MMKMLQERNDSLLNEVKEETVHFTIKMPDYEVAYSMPRYEDNALIKEEVFIPQLLVGNQIAGQEHNQQKENDCWLTENSEKTSEDDIEEFSLEKPFNISVRKDLHMSTSEVQRGMKWKQKYRQTNVPNDGLCAAEKMLKVVTKDVVESRRSVEMDWENNRTYDRQHNDKHEYSKTRIPKRKYEGNCDKYLEPACKAAKSSNSAMNSEIHGNSPILKKIRSDCLLALKQDLHGNYPLHNAVLQSNLKLVSRFSSVLSAMNQSIDLPNFQGMTALLLAVDLRQSSAVSYLVRIGADPAVATDDGNTSYHLAVKRKDRKSLMELMKRRLNREDVDLLNDKGLTPLHLAVIARDEIMVKMLLAFGARPDSQDARNGKTATFLATELGCSAIVQLLSSYGASASLASFSGVAPASISQESRTVGGVVNTSQHCFRSDLLEHFYSQL